MSFLEKLKELFSPRKENEESDIGFEKAVEAVKNKDDVLIGCLADKASGYIKVFRAKDAEVLTVEEEGFEVIAHNGEAFWDCRILKKFRTE